MYINNPNTKVCMCEQKSPHSVCTLQDILYRLHIMGCFLFLYFCFNTWLSRQSRCRCVDFSTTVLLGEGDMLPDWSIVIMCETFFSFSFFSLNPLLCSLLTGKFTVWPDFIVSCVNVVCGTSCDKKSLHPCAFTLTQPNIVLQSLLHFVVQHFF